jgi:hypothetical protein
MFLNISFVEISGQWMVVSGQKCGIKLAAEHWRLPTI